MEARVISKNRWNSVNAFGRLEYVKTEWRTVPKGSEAEAKAHEALETRVSKPTPKAPTKASDSGKAKGKAPEKAADSGKAKGKAPEKAEAAE